MNEYQDQEVWFELYGHDGEFQWHFIADFDTREEAEKYAKTSPVMGEYYNHRIRRVSGLV